MKHKPHILSDPSTATRSERSCASNRCTTGGCGGPGLCPAIALFIAWTAGIGIATLTGLEWLGWAIGIPLILILLTGAWHRLPTNRADSARSVDNAS